MSKSDNNQSIDYTLKMGHGRDLSDDGWEKVMPLDIEYWKTATSILKNYQIKIREFSYNIQFDWKPLLRRHQYNYSVMEKLHFEMHGKNRKDEVWKLLDSFKNSDVQINCRSMLPEGYETPDEDETPYKLRASDYSVLAVESSLHDVFLIMNIASPGSCNMTCKVGSSNKIAFSPKIKLGNYFFDSATLHSHGGKWPPLSNIPLEQVLSWFNTVRNQGSQVPESNLEKVLFAILHICLEDLSHTTILWLFNALETLFDTRPGENFRSLVSRIGLLLSPNKQEMKTLNANLRKMYEFRSSFIHGGIEVYHPMMNEIIDTRVDEKFSRIMHLSDFGFTLLIASIHEIIRRDWHEITFTDELVGQTKQATNLAAPQNIPTVN